MSHVAKSVASIVCLLFAAGAHAADSDGDHWQFQATLYLYLPTFGGKADLPPSGSADDVGLSMDQILDNLKMVFMGTFEARRGAWGLFTDLVYMDVGNHKTDSRSLEFHGVPLPAGATANVEFDLKGLLWTLAGSHRVIETPAITLDFLAGSRLIDITPRLNWTVNGNVGSVALPNRVGSRDAELQNWDAIIGAKGRFAFGQDRKWFVPYYIDIGAGESNFTFQAMAGIGYAFKWGDIFAAWRYVDYSMGSNTVVETFSLNGPLVAATFHW